MLCQPCLLFFVKERRRFKQIFTDLMFASTLDRGFTPLPQETIRFNTAFRNRNHEVLLFNNAFLGNKQQLIRRTKGSNIALLLRVILSLEI